MKSAVGMVFVAVAAVGCGNTSGPLSDALSGDYDYRLEFPPGSGIATRSFSGTARVTYASDDSIAGVWHNVIRTGVNGDTSFAYEPSFQLGFRNGSAYVVYARRLTGGTNVHRFAPTKSGLTCESAGYLYGTLSGNIVRVEATCTLAKR